jgi:hypothetical protein
VTDPESAEAVRAGDRACGPVTMQSVADLIRQFPKPVHRELHCHPSVAGVLRMSTTEAQPPFPGVIGSLTGIPVIEDLKLGVGEWELREDGMTHSSGVLEAAERLWRVFDPRRS